MQSNIKWAADPRANLHLLKTRFGSLIFIFASYFMTWF